VPGMVRDKVLALIKSLHQRPRSRLLPLPEFAAGFVEQHAFADGSLIEVLLKAVRDKTQLPVQRNDFKLEQVSAHLFMNFRVVDEHGRQLGAGRDLAGLKAELGHQARNAFQALAALKLAGNEPRPEGAPLAKGAAGARAPATHPPTPGSKRSAVAAGQGAGGASDVATAPVAQRYTDWRFGELPELMEVRRGGQSLIGFPALIDHDTHVEIEVYDEPQVAASRHRAGLRRLVALQLREPLKYLEKNVPDLQKMAAAYMSLGTMEELRAQVIEVALDRAFLAEPLPTDEASFRQRIEAGRTRLNLIAAEVARQAGAVLIEYTAALRKLKDSRASKDVAEDIGAQLQRLMPKRFLVQTEWSAMQHLPRYLKGIVLRLDKWRSDADRDAARLAELRPLEQRWLRRVADLRGAPHERLDEFRWLLEELRISLFAQELRTPQPVSVKRLDKAWAQVSGS
jgi:ATP-dependent helicase HrpA